METRLWDGLSRARLLRTTEDRRLETPSHRTSRPNRQFPYRHYLTPPSAKLIQDTFVFLDWTPLQTGTNPSPPERISFVMLS